jgi:hypothetical protein
LKIRGLGAGRIQGLGFFRFRISPQLVEGIACQWGLCRILWYLPIHFVLGSTDVRVGENLHEQREERRVPDSALLHDSWDVSTGAPLDHDLVKGNREVLGVEAGSRRERDLGVGRLVFNVSVPGAKDSSPPRGCGNLGARHASVLCFENYVAGGRISGNLGMGAFRFFLAEV